ncbi:hypothetical protein ACEPPU_24245 [Priestia aryabhattai]|uniref:hypothetical protein n=1 Tax=Priestia aryabhattai TaxID=412384 RepID=UPI0035AB8ACF
MKTKKYYVSYSYSNGFGSFGFGGTFITSDRDMFDDGVLEKIRVKIKESNGYEELMIMNFVEQGERK